MEVKQNKKKIVKRGEKMHFGIDSENFKNVDGDSSLAEVACNGTYSRSKTSIIVIFVGVV